MGPVTMRLVNELDLDSTSTASRFRHAGWHPIRKRVFAALQATHVPLSRRNAFASCGNAATLMESDATPGTYRLAANHCHDRLCTPCANARSAEIARCLAGRLQGLPVSFITLTLCGKGEGLGELVKRLYTSFRALRIHPRWQDKVRGGAAFLEIKYSDKARRWHPHLHLIADADYIDQGELSDIWRGITRDSFIVDVRRVRDDNTVLRYVTKYASKPLNTSFSNDPSLLQEAITSLHGKRLCFCFGTWYRTPLHEVDASDDAPGSWSPICTLSELIDRCDRGEPDARALLVAAGLEHKWRAYLLSDTS